VLDWYRQLIALRHAQPDLTDPDLADTKVAYDGEARWLAFRRGDVRVAVNLAKEAAAIPLGTGRVEVLAAWDPVEEPGPDGLLQVPGESCVVLAQP
jgi:maltooligosyltrehalose trehalohydrolase